MNKSRQRQLMKRALELAKDDPGASKDWYSKLSGSDRTLLDAGLKEFQGTLHSIQALAQAPKRVLEEAIHHLA